MARATAEIISPSTTDDLPEGSANKYDTGVPPATQDDLPDGSTAKQYTATEQTKLGTIEDDAKDDQSGAEIQTAIEGLSDANRKLILSEPLSGEHKIYGIHRNAAGNAEYDYEDQAEP